MPFYKNKFFLIPQYQDVENNEYDLKLNWIWILDWVKVTDWNYSSSKNTFGFIFPWIFECNMPASLNLIDTKLHAFDLLQKTINFRSDFFKRFWIFLTTRSVKKKKKDYTWIFGWLFEYEIYITAVFWCKLITICTNVNKHL